MKNLKISKELIKNVLVQETENLSDDFTFNIEDNYIMFADDGEQLFEMNIYEFAFKCKELALDKGYKIQSQINGDNEGHSHITKKNDDVWAKGFFGNTEVEVIIKSCEFILTKRNQNENK